MSPCNWQPPFAHPVFVHMFTCKTLCWKVRGIYFYLYLLPSKDCVQHLSTQYLNESLQQFSLLTYTKTEAPEIVCLKHVSLSMVPITPKVSSPRGQVSEDNWHPWTHEVLVCVWEGGWGEGGRAADFRNHENSERERNWKMPWMTNLTPSPSYLTSTRFHLCREWGHLGRFYKRPKLYKRKAAFLCYLLLLYCLLNKNSVSLICSGTAVSSE